MLTSVWWAYVEFGVFDARIVALGLDTPRYFGLFL